MANRILGTIGAALLMFGGARAARAQQCPHDAPAGTTTASRAVSLQGRLIHHDGIRSWFELRLDRPVCGRKSIEMTMLTEDWKPLQRLRGCRTRSLGTLDFSPTGYYTLDVFQEVSRVRPIGACVPRPPFPDWAKARPDRHVRRYRVDMHLDYRPGDHPIRFDIRSGSTRLQPWQAYARYEVTGSYVLYGECAEGFVLDRLWGPPAAQPRHFTEAGDPSDMAAFDPESAAAKGQTDLRLGYSCVRAR